MIKNLRKNIATLFAALALMAIPLALTPATASAADIGINDKLKCGSNLDIKNPDSCDNVVTQGNEGFNKIIKDIINIFSIIVGIVAIIMIIYGGARYIASGGDPGKVGDAKNTIIYAVIGLVVVGIAQFIVQFVLDKVSAI